MIRPVTNEDAISLVDIYNYYISDTVITFEESLVTQQNMLDRIAKVSAEELPWLVYENDQGQVIGYAYATKWRERHSYRFSVEVTVYLAHGTAKKGLGTQLYNALFYELKRLSIHVVIGGITLPNQASVALHEKFGMVKVAHFKEVGFKFEQWLDVGYWQSELD